MTLYSFFAFSFFSFAVLGFLMFLLPLVPICLASFRFFKRASSLFDSLFLLCLQLFQLCRPGLLDVLSAFSSYLPCPPSVFLRELRLSLTLYSFFAFSFFSFAVLGFLMFFLPLVPICLASFRFFNPWHSPLSPL